ncbi:putative membrane protein DUF2238 [Lentzea atacamensis]|uniref:Membrane protein DUF2238 n=1 Tax=Lentzea atacamensis TaxID=531938 RepID=A0ABX9E5U7_9PSEU|nr:putative membrane protein DUF2238 [Lentzea atacamensis]
MALWLLRRRLDTAQWAWALLFLALHTISARWIYSFVPYDDWTDTVFGVRLSEAFSWERNHFDRLVRFAYGVCLTAVLRLKWLRSLEIGSARHQSGEFRATAVTSGSDSMTGTRSNSAGTSGSRTGSTSSRSSAPTTSSAV